MPEVVVEEDLEAGQDRAKSLKVVRGVAGDRERRVAKRAQADREIVEFQTTKHRWGKAL